MAMNYRPGIDERPDFNFKGVDQEYGNKVKKAVVDRTDPNLQKTIDSNSPTEDSSPEVKKERYAAPEKTSVPERFLEPVRPLEDPDAHKVFVS